MGREPLGTREGSRQPWRGSVIIWELHTPLASRWSRVEGDRRGGPFPHPTTCGLFLGGGFQELEEEVGSANPAARWEQFQDKGALSAAW